MTGAGPDPVVDLAGHGFEEAVHLLLDHGMRSVPVGGRLGVRGYHPALEVHLAVWCRERGHRLLPPPGTARGGPHWVVRGRAEVDRWAGAERAGGAAPSGIAPKPPPSWGLAARGALVEAGGPPLSVDFDERDVVWADLAPQLYAHAAAAQWDPATAVPWAQRPALPPEIEAAVVQVMTYLVENEQAALVVPARLLSRVHPHFREVLQLLAVQAADEARHIEVFTRRALLTGSEMGTSSAGGRASLATLLSESDFSIASFLLSVLGEGSFLHLLSFLDRHAPDPVTRKVARLARQDEARHVAFGVAHLAHQAQRDPGLRIRLRAAVERRRDALVDTAGLNQDVHDALIVLAAGEWTAPALARGHAAVRQLQEGMDEGRRHRLVHLGFPPDEAAEVSALHTRNFM
jgi:hypothetical protein